MISFRTCQILHGVIKILVRSSSDRPSSRCKIHSFPSCSSATSGSFYFSVISIQRSRAKGHLHKAWYVFSHSTPQILQTLETSMFRRNLSSHVAREFVAVFHPKMQVSECFLDVKLQRESFSRTTPRACESRGLATREPRPVTMGSY